jgi:hypothetical protein
LNHKEIGCECMDWNCMAVDHIQKWFFVNICRNCIFFMFMVPCIMNLIFVSFQRDATVISLYFISLQDLSTCFGRSLHPSSGVLKTAYAATGTSHMMWQVSSIMR